MKNYKKKLVLAIYIFVVVFLVSGCSYPAREDAIECAKEIYPNGNVYIQYSNSVDRCIVVNDSVIYEISFKYSVFPKINGVTKLYPQQYYTENEKE